MLFETQPNMKRTFRQYRGKKHSELRINEDLQRTIMYLMSILKRLVTNIIILTKLHKYILLLCTFNALIELFFRYDILTTIELR